MSYWSPIRVPLVVLESYPFRYGRLIDSAAGWADLISDCGKGERVRGACLARELPWNRRRVPKRRVVE